MSDQQILGSGVTEDEIRTVADKARMIGDGDLMEAGPALTQRERDIHSVYGPNYPVLADSEAWARKMANKVLTDDRIPPSARQELSEWWENEAHDEIAMVVDKAIEYSSTDLEDIGRNLARLMGRQNVSDAEAAELGLHFYIEGKLARWRGALMDRRPVSADTLRDLGIYVRMMQRVQQTGGWPGTKEQLSD